MGTFCRKEMTKAIVIFYLSLVIISVVSCKQAPNRRMLSRKQQQCKLASDKDKVSFDWRKKPQGTKDRLYIFVHGWNNDNSPQNWSNEDFAKPGAGVVFAIWNSGTMLTNLFNKFLKFFSAFYKKCPAVALQIVNEIE